MMKKVCWPYFDPEFESLEERIYGPKVTIDNKSLEDCTVVKVDSVNKQGLLLKVVQGLTDMNLTISKGFISSDAAWFMDVFHVKDMHGNKIRDQRVLNYIQQTIGTTREAEEEEGSFNTRNKLFQSHPNNEHTAIEMTGTDRPGLFSEISAALAELHCNVVEAHAWSHNARLACVVYISDQFTGTPINDSRLAAIEGHLTTVLRSTTAARNPAGDCSSNGHHPQQEVKTAASGLQEGEGPSSTATTTDVERRLHQLMLSVRDFDNDRPSSLPLKNNNSDMKKKQQQQQQQQQQVDSVSIESCSEKGYSIVTVQCRDRPRLMFDTVCTLTDMQYVIFHASVDSHGGDAFQEYFIRHVDGRALNTRSEEERVVKCLEAAIERRVCEGVRLELCAKNRVGLLSDITRVLRENGLAVLRADVATQGGKATHAFYVRDISGNDVDMEFLESMKKEMGPIDLAVKNEKALSRTSTDQRARFSISDILKSQIERLSHNFVEIK